MFQLFVLSTANYSKYECKSVSNSYLSNSNNIKMLSKITYKSGNKTGKFMFSSERKIGNIVPGLCPGASNFKCCLPKVTTTKKLKKKKVLLL